MVDMTDVNIPQGNSVAHQLYNDILTGIQMGEYPPLSPLPTEAALSHDYGVSRTIVRSALSVLKQDGLVISKQGSGTIVAPSVENRISQSEAHFDLEELEQCYVCRETLEPNIASRAAANRNAGHLEYLEAQLETISSELAQGVLHTGNDADFHIHLAEMAGNGFFVSIMNSLRPYILIGMNLAKTLPPHERHFHEQESLKEHLEIASAVARGNSHAARLAMLHHLTSGRARIFAHRTRSDDE